MKNLPIDTELPLSDYITTPTKAPRTSSGPASSISQLLEKGSHHGNSTQEGQSFFAVDLGEPARRIRQWREHLPRVEPFYAIKCNSNPQILRSLAKLGIGFDCASKAEIASILKLGVDPSRIIFANPCKPISHVRYALSHGVGLMTFDNEDELIKISRISRDARLVLRLLADDSRSSCRFGLKFGAPAAAVPRLLGLARDLGLRVVGVSFHVGSGCSDPSAFGDAVELAHSAFEVARSLGFEMELLDLGGGFPGLVGGAEGVPAFAEIASCLNRALDTFFPPSSGVRIIAEPGRYVVTSAFTLAVCIQARRTISPGAGDGEEPRYMYYVSDGVYGSFNCVMFDHAKPVPKVLRRGGEFLLPSSPTLPLRECTLWGPTCDSMDLISPKAFLPELAVGDWLYFENMGAYTLAAASTFNGFPLAALYYVDTEKS